MKHRKMKCVAIASIILSEDTHSNLTNEIMISQCYFNHSFVTEINNVQMK